MAYFLIAFAIYLTIGVLRTLSDFAQPVINQPHYVRHPTVAGILLSIVLWPLPLLMQFLLR